MLAVLSDLHFQEAGRAGPVASSGPRALDVNVRPIAFRHLWQQIGLLRERVGADDPITVVLAGDILELLRSERWLTEGTRPYNFSGELDPAALATAQRIGAAILEDNTEAIGALGGAGATPVKWVYVYGNHDRLLRHEALAGVRARFAELLGGPVLYVDKHHDERHRVAIRHGHELDWTNSEYQLAREFDGLLGEDPGRRMLAPLGDWVALELGARLGHLSWQMLSDDGAAYAALRPVQEDLYARLLHLDDLRPQGESLRWLSRPSHLGDLLQREGERAALERFLGDLMNALVTEAMPKIEPWLEAHDRPLFDRLALGAVGLLGSTKYTATSLPSVMERMNAYLSGDEKPWHVVRKTPEYQAQMATYYVSGHTHEPMVQPLRDEGTLAAAGVRGAWYVNTGTWRKVILRSPVDADAYGAMKQVAYATFYDEAETARSQGLPAPSAADGQAVSMDLWQGATQRY